MANVKLNPVFLQMRGNIGDLVFKRYRGRVIVARKPDLSNIEPSPAQLAQRELFRQAALYGKLALADSQLHSLYEQAAAEKGLPVFALTVADYFHAPEIDEIDLQAYNGNVGEEIVVYAHDNVAVNQVQVSLRDENDQLMENGLATEEPAGSGRWVYSALTQAPYRATVRVVVTASDLPGGATISTVEKEVESPISPNQG
ncbi:MAG: hypothetical protein JXA13_02735 [Anaerolineales bacterium]|nr:hypothetical protein [Anaerolineales bacterium]